MTLICGTDLKSNPSATISWTNPNRSLVVNSDNFTRNDGPEEVALDITNVGKDDNGTWTCTVEVPRNKPHHCSSEKESEPRIKQLKMQLIVVSKLKVRLFVHVSDSCLSFC